MTDSQTLLAEYARSRSEPAFRELVSRYIDLVYSTAFRLVGGDAQSAQDVAQTVFVALAAKAGTLPEDVMLGGWLHQHTRFAAGKFMRTERRRQLRERQAAEMNAIEDHSESNLAQVAPVLDEAIGQLEAEDRTAILLRFFERKDFRGVGDALGSSEDAARKRVDRALEKLHVLLKNRGAALSAAALGTALAAEAVAAAPAGLAAGVAGTALASAAAGGTTLALAKMLIMTKIKLTILSAIVVASVAAPLVIQHRSQVQLRQENKVLRQQVVQLGQLATENERLSNLVAQGNISQVLPKNDQKDLLRLRGEVTRLRAAAPKTALEAEALAWPARVRKLRERLEQTPEHKIPELQLLTEDDWLAVARSELNTEEDYRKTLSALRGLAEQTFMAMAFRALERYVQTNNAHSLTDLSQLKPYFASPIDDAIFNRYKILEKPIDPTSGEGPEITTKAPLDKEYDFFRVSITPKGYSKMMF